MKYVIRNGHVIDPVNGVDGICSVFVENTAIAALGRCPRGFMPGKKSKIREIDAAGQFVMPGVVDTCARLREPGEEHKATIASEAHAAVAGGITTLVCPPDTRPVVDTPSMVSMIIDRANAAGKARVIPQGALTVGLEGKQISNMAMLMDAGCAGISNGLNSIENTLVLRRALQYASTFGATVSMTPHDHWLLGNGTVHEGEVSTRLGLPAIPEAAETVGVARDIALIETTGVRAHFDLLSCGRSAKMVHEAQRRKLPLTAGVAIHQLLLDERAVGEFDTMCKTYPPLRTAEDKKQLRSALKRGVISCICSDHKPHGKDAKLAPFSEAASGISGLDSFMSLAWSLVADGVIDRMQLVSVVSSNPASLIGSPAGNLGAGSPADIIVFDPDRKWTLNSKSMLSRGKNSPFLDSYRCGKVTKTWVAGKLVFEDESH